LPKGFRPVEHALKKIVLQRKLADLGVQRGQIDRLARLRSGAKGVGRVFEQLPPPLGDLVGMPLEMLGQLGQGLGFAQGRQSYLGLERRRMGAPG
jgi:hypothetical protein